VKVFQRENIQPKTNSKTFSRIQIQKRSAEYKVNLSHEQGHLDFALTVSKFVVEGEHISISCLLALWSLCQYSVPKTLDRQLVPQKHHDCLST
jgi:hypothetical protein